MDKYRRLAELLTGKQGRKEIFFNATVVSISGNTCTVSVDDLELDNVRLRPTTDDLDNEILLIPAEGTTVLVGSHTGDLSNLFVLAADAVSEVKLSISEMSIEMTKDGIVLNGGELGGLITIASLVSKLNTLESSLNTLKTIFNSWVPIATDGGVALKTIVSEWATATITATKVSDLEDKNVTH